MIFVHRTHAGQLLAGERRPFENWSDVVVLGLARGGIPVAFEVGNELAAPLDVFVVRKLGVPGREELAFGAIASGGIRIVDEQTVEAFGISEGQIAQIAAREELELERRERLYRRGRPALAVEGKTILLVDDGIATGASVEAAITALRRLRPGRIVLATPVAAASTCSRLRPQVDDLISLRTPESFYGIGQFYEDFSQVSDEEVSVLLRLNAEHASETAVTHPSGRKGEAP